MLKVECLLQNSAFCPPMSVQKRFPPPKPHSTWAGLQMGTQFNRHQEVSKQLLPVISGSAIPSLIGACHGVP